MLQRLLITGLISGAIAGIILTIVHLSIVQPLIVKAEIYEQGISKPAAIESHIHKSGISHSHAGGNIPHLHEKNFHIHAEGATHVHPSAEERHSHTGQNSLVKRDAHMHSHGEHIWAPKDGLERSLFSLAANVLTAIAFALLLVSAFTVYGGSISLHRGLLWGLAGFTCFSFLPGLGLPPELPAAAAGDLLDRQIWWLGTASLSIAGLSFIVFGKSIGWRAVGLLLLVIPHAIGAPLPEAGEVGASPPELAAHFVMLSLFASATMWMVIGVVTAFLYDRILIEDREIFVSNLTN